MIAVDVRQKDDAEASPIKPKPTDLGSDTSGAALETGVYEDEPVGALDHIRRGREHLAQEMHTRDDRDELGAETRQRALVVASGDCHPAGKAKPEHYEKT
jgi:hypothetical protein